MRRAALTVFVLILIGATAVDATARTRHKATPKCSPGHSHLIVADAQAQLYVAPLEPSTPGLPSVSGCVYGHHRSYFLGELPRYSSQGGGGIQHEVLYGAMAAYEEITIEQTFNGQISKNLIVVLNLRNGRVLYKVPTGTPTEPEDVGDGEATTIVVKKSDGAAAWIGGGSVEVGGKQVRSYVVHVVDRAGTGVIASSPEIDPSSLKIRGNRVYWTQGGKPFSAVLN